MAKEEKSNLEAHFKTIMHLKIHFNLGSMTTMLKSNGIH